MIEVEALGIQELTNIFPKTCDEYLEFLKETESGVYIDEESLNGDKSFLNSALNDQFIPSEISIVGCVTKKSESWLERRLLYKIDKKSDQSSYLGEALSYLGKRISRLGSGRYGIQDVSVSEPDGYYILIYGIEED